MNWAIINGILAQLKSLKASWVTSGRFPLTRMPDMALNKIMVGQGATNSPVEEDKYTDAKVLAVAAALVHAARHENGGDDEISVAGLSGLLADDQHVLDAEVLLVAAALVHAARHKDGGADELDVSELAGAIGGAGEVPETDGAAVTWVDPDGRYDPKAHHATHESGGADEIKDMELNNAPGTNDTGSGLVTVDTVGENVAAGQVLYMKADGKYWLAKGDAVATMPGKVLAMGTILADAAGKLLHLGYFRHDAWDFTMGNGTANLLYVDKTTGGLVTQTPPAAAGDQVQVVGYCVTADIIFFNPCLELVEIS